MLHKHEPIAEKEMLKRSPEYTICEVLRIAYCRTVDSEARDLIRVATRMAKRMDMRLQSYREDWANGFWDKTKEIQGDINAHI